MKRIIMQNVFFPKCVRCHNLDGQASFLPLDSYQSFLDNKDYLLNGFEDAKNSYLVQIITDPEEPMPPLWSNIERLNENEINVVVEWIKKDL